MPVNKTAKWKVESEKWKGKKPSLTFHFPLSTFVFIVVACLFFFNLSAQDTTEVKEKKVHPHSPAKAMLYSAVCPGLGQIYNRKYWKLPIVYVGLGVAAYFIITNQRYYNTYKDAFSNPNNQYYGLYSPSELSSIVDYYHKDRDLSIIIAAGIYLLQIVDANVDAQLHGFNVTDDISLHFSPGLTPNPMSGTMCFTPGFSLVKKL
ncbi:MAG TPA: DUF5683 domain-containing protein [Bacteroidia bacterium]|jgi:hypothetical protein|nr:DUF5683 domain-containing protein [Bacteroidia bacterium]